MRIPFEKGKIRLTSPYGERELEGTSGFHGGIDIVGLESTRVVSACSGVVAQSTVVTDKSNANWMWGEYIIILGDDGRTYFYFHLASRAVKRFDRVAEGDYLGEMGNTGYSFGAHLHFEVREGDAATRINAADVLGIPNREGIYPEDDAVSAQKSGDDPSAWAKDYTDWAKSAGLFISDGNGNYRWRDGITREELCAVLYRFLRIIEG
ncbi:MAG: M23 family metallopeptidase [Clostridia bacterium]|nr:M23 family metallopeptidase [Clostridia bacterium]